MPATCKVSISKKNKKRKPIGCGFHNPIGAFRRKAVYKNDFKLEGKTFLTKKNIYRIVAYLEEYIGEYKEENERETYIEYKSKTWKKYMDCYQKMFNVSLSKNIPVADGILCACFILLLDADYCNRFKDEDQDYIKKIKRCTNEEEGTFEEILDYDEKNEIISNLDCIFESIDYKQFGIKDISSIEEGHDGKKIYHIKYEISDMSLFIKRQINFEMIIQIEPYGDDLMGIIDKLRMHTALEEMRWKFIENTIDVLQKNMNTFLYNLLNEIERKEKEWKIFDITSKSGYCKEVMEKEVIDTFNEYIEKEFDFFKQKWISESKDFSFEPDILINKL